MQSSALASLDQVDPTVVGVGEFLLVLQALAQIGQIFLIARVLLQGIERGLRGGFRFIAAGRRVALGESFGLLPGGLAIFFVFLDLRGQRFVALVQTQLLGLALFLRRLQLIFFLAQRPPCSVHAQESVRWIVLFVRIYRRAEADFRAVLARFMLRLQALDFRLRIAAGLLEIFGGVLRLILIQVHLRFGNIDLVLQVVFLR